MVNRFEGKRVLVTGAASGMGRAAALNFAREGAVVFCADLNEEGADKTATDAGNGAVFAKLDVSNGDACRQCVANAVSALGGLDVLCNIAGIGGLKALSEETDENWRLTMAVNADGPFYMSQAALPHLLASKGNIVNISSTAGVQGQAYMSSYVASKHALTGFTKTMALEFGRKGLRVNAICPGGTKTAFLAGFRLPDDVDMDLIARNALISEMAEAEDIASSICFLASDDAKFINGAVLTVDGGAVAG